jgi:hypothetical protein
VFPLIEPRLLAGASRYTLPATQASHPDQPDRTLGL